MTAKRDTCQLRIQSQTVSANQQPVHRSGHQWFLDLVLEDETRGDDNNRVCTGPGKSWNFIMAFSWKKATGPGKSWKSVKLN